jgi:hypothetical protein
MSKKVRVKKNWRIPGQIYFVYVDYTQCLIFGEFRPYYVGIGNSSRVRYPTRNDYHVYLAEMCGFRREVIICSKDLEFIFEQEIRLIAEFKTLFDEPDHITYWRGANLTRGGQCGPGMSSEQAKEIWKRPEVRLHRAEASAAYRALLTIEEKQDRVEKWLASMARRTEEQKLLTRQLLMIAGKRRFEDPVELERNRQSAIQQFQNPSKRNNHLESVRRPDVIARKSKSRKRFEIENPAVRVMTVEKWQVSVSNKTKDEKRAWRDKQRQTLLETNAKKRELIAQGDSTEIAKFEEACEKKRVAIAKRNERKRIEVLRPVIPSSDELIIDLNLAAE